MKSLKRFCTLRKNILNKFEELMHSNINVVPATDDLKFGTDTALVKFFVDSEKLESVVDNFFFFLNETLNRLQKKNFLDKEQTELVYCNQKSEPAVVYLRKVKLDKNFNLDFFRNYFAGLIPSIKSQNVKDIHVVVPSFTDYIKHFESEEYFLQTMVEGIYLGNYTFDKYKSGNKKPVQLNIYLHYSNQKVLNKVITVSNKLMSAVYLTRNLVNEPANNLSTTELASFAKSELGKVGVKVNVFDKAELKRRKMNAILAVGSASDKPPCMIIIHYKPKTKPRKKIALVGKGVTYDSGGLSIKPTASMMDMNSDMAGGAAVIGIIKTAAELKLPLEIIGVIPAVENMINGAAYKPTDIIKTYSGKTIEVRDTDAEGRIILADALHYASQQKPDEIIDFATLTGACVVALGEIVGGLFTSNDKLADALYKSGMKTYERVWRLPFWNDYNDMIKSEIADVKNLGPRWGGAITAGKFLENFVDENIPWAHLDIAGPAVKHKLNNYTEKYHTGFGVRLITEYLLSL
jgi:leucyl aminopeptidase